MQCETRRWMAVKGWESPAELGKKAGLVLVFGDVGEARDGVLAEIREAYPGALVAGCSSAGEIMQVEVRTGSLTTIAMGFGGTRVEGHSVRVADSADSDGVGRAAAALLKREGLVHVMIFSDGMGVDGAALARGVRAGLPEEVAVTGGLAGDADRFKQTWVCCGNECAAGRVAVVGFYGKGLRVGHGSLGGWDPFGQPMTITRAEGSVLYELDGRPALEVYERYLGAYAVGLPATGLLFPFAIHQGEEKELVRTILAVDREKQSLTFAGEMPMGIKTRLMKANFEHLVEGAIGAARAAKRGLGQEKAEAAILISCVGRRLVLRTRVEEEVEAVRRVLGPQAVMAGFYSYGEIAPSALEAGCDLHNQTMTITTFWEE